MKKTVCILLIISILMNFILCSVSYADGQSDGTDDITSSFLNPEGDPDKEAPPSDTASSSILEEGKTSRKNGEEATETTNSSVAGRSMIGVILGYLALIIDVIPLQFHVILSIMSITDVSTPATNKGSISDFLEIDFWITLERILFNKIALFNINYFNSENDYTVGSGANEVIITVSDANLNIKESVTKMFMICRILALIIGFLVLIYIGIRMALSTVASEEAKYKKMLFSWVESIVIMFLLVYIMVLIINFGELLTNIFYNIKCALQSSGEESFEFTIVNQIFEGIFNSSGLKLAMYSIMYWVLVYTHFKFFFLYLKRLLIVGFLIVIAPLITITYSIDKAGDGKAQAFGAWLSEFLMNVLVQPLHGIIYIIFMFTAGEIAKYAPILGLVFMMSLGTVEKTVKRMFNMGNLASIAGINESLPKKGK